ncbi:MAG: nucleotidyltransferase domain-containing protein [Saprospiraceae bacterium]|nr:nucleotidyltransferase domain-containing protein [Saprospiraceae bacterium]
MPLPTQQIRDYFRTQPVIRAWLFGSYADGTATENSDVDILVTLDHSRAIGLHYVQMILDLEELLGKKVDLVADEGLSKYVRPYVEKQKKLIYERPARG